jgi:hypothetical protein
MKTSSSLIIFLSLLCSTVSHSDEPTTTPSPKKNVPHGPKKPRKHLLNKKPAASSTTEDNSKSDLTK